MYVTPKIQKNFLNYFLSSLPYLICLLFIIAYTVLSFVRHSNYQSFGYDLGINDQLVWKYAHFHLPVTTIDPFPGRTKFAEHVELIYPILAPFYWIWDTRRMLLLLEVVIVCSASIAVYLLAKKKKLHPFISISLVIGYLAFYGVQNALWDDVHSASFGAAFLMWFIYFLETKNKWLSILFFFLTITAKENFGLLTFLISGVYFLKEKDKITVFFMAISVLYVGFIFYVFFPHIMHVTYLYQNKGGIFSNITHISSFIDTSEKRQVILYSLLSFGFLPILSPLYLIPVVGDLATYFVVANQLSGAQGFFGQYRISLTPLLIFGTILTIAKFKHLNKWYIGIYLLGCTAFAQYTLHLPLSYLTKEYFWQQPASVQTINIIIEQYLPRTASVVSQNNITPHISHRDNIYTLYPDKAVFTKNSPCEKNICDWFRWEGHPTLLLVDTAKDWDARHLLTNREEFLQGLQNIEKAKIVTKYKQLGTTILYKINKNPDVYK